MKKIISSLLILCIVTFAFSGCYSVDVTEFPAHTSTEDLLYTAPLVFLGRVQEQGAGFHRNKNGVQYDADGRERYNYWITPYAVEVLEVYKGDLKEGITELVVSTYNDYSPGEMKLKKITADTFYLQKDDTAIFCVYYMADDGCYTTVYEDQGVFYATKTENQYASGGKILDVTKMDEILEKASVTGKNLLAGSGRTPTINPDHKEPLLIK